MRRKTALVDYFCCGKINVRNEALKINPYSFCVAEGFNQYVDKPQTEKKQYAVSFIGNLYGKRRAQIEHLRARVSVEVISNAYG